MTGDTDRYFDRDASDLEYQARVLARAGDDTLPLLERVKFLAIFSTLSDEFFRVRIAGLNERAALGIDERSLGGNTASEQLATLHHRFGELLGQQRQLFEQEIVPALATAGIAVVQWSDLAARERRDLTDDFERHVKPILTPLAVGPAHPFPFISDLSLSIGITLDDSTDSQFGRVKVPDVFDRFRRVDEDGATKLVAVEEVIGAHLSEVFPGRTVRDWGTFRVTRNADYDVEDVEDLLDAVASEMLQRRFGRAVRLEVDDDVSDTIQSLLQLEHDLDDDAVFVQNRPLGLGQLWELYELDRPDLKEPAWRPVEPAAFRRDDLFDVIRRGDVMVHHPYESFATSTQQFIERAAIDPGVLAIKQTLYRTSGDSPVVEALMTAAREGKQVAALIELKARFDEEANIRWAEQLEEAGVHVVYGFVDIKTHSKTALVVRRDPDGVVRRYGHVATGNYNPSTAKSYEDIGVFTVEPVVIEDLSELFNMLTTHSREGDFDRLLVAPVNMLERLLDLIEGQARPGGHVTIKVNNLTHPDVIGSLYAASQAGARVELIVRSVCSLRPGVAGLSENVTVRSIVGPFLEHSRIFRFGPMVLDDGDGNDGDGNDGDDDDDARARVHLIGSADLMTRNLDNRIEALIPVSSDALRRRLDDVLELCLADNQLAWTLDPQGTWNRFGAGDEPAVDVQAELRRRIRDGASTN